MPALLFTAALATGQPSGQTARWTDPAASARAGLVQDLSAVVSGTAPFAAGQRLGSDTSTAPLSLRLTGAGVVATGADTGTNSVIQSATAVSARVVLPRLP